MAGILVSATTGCKGDPSAATPREVRVAVGSRGGDFWNFGQALEEAARARHAAYTVTLNTAVGLRTLQAVNDGTSDCGFAFANLAYEGFSGKREGQPGQLDALRGVASIEITPLNLVVRRASPIRQVSDLVGRRVVIGLPDSGSYRAATLVLEAHGLLAQEETVEIIAENFGKARQYLESGKADAIFQLRRRPPISTAEDGRLVPIDGPPMAALRRQYPFFRAALIPMGSYEGQPAPVKTVGIESVFLCREALSPELVRQVTGDWFAGVDQLISDGVVSEAFTRQAAAATPIPLHQGARDFYRARQVLLRD